MKTLEKIVLHPKMENEHRNEVRSWCEQNIYYKNWSINSNYDDHGCFNITIWGNDYTKMATDFLLRYPETKILEKQFDESYEIAPEALALFDFED